MSPNRIARFCEQERLDFVLLTDHETIRGAELLQKLIRRRRLNIEAPLAAEYRTSHGDVIAAFIHTEIRTRVWSEVVSEVRRQGGLLLLPHPYDDHRDVGIIGQDVDLIEVFNARSSPANNRASADLAKRLGKPVYWGCDAHIASTLGRVLVEVQAEGTLLESLRRGAIVPLRAAQASMADLVVSQFVKAVRRRDARLFASLCIGLAASFWRRLRRIA